jgi:hypothetical protein
MRFVPHVGSEASLPQKASYLTQTTLTLAVLGISPDAPSSVRY